MALLELVLGISNKYAPASAHLRSIREVREILAGRGIKLSWSSIQAKVFGKWQAECYIPGAYEEFGRFLDRYFLNRRAYKTLSAKYAELSTGDILWFILHQRQKYLKEERRFLLEACNLALKQTSQLWMNYKLSKEMKRKRLRSLKERINNNSIPLAESARKLGIEDRHFTSFLVGLKKKGYFVKAACDLIAPHIETKCRLFYRELARKFAVRVEWKALKELILRAQNRRERLTEAEREIIFKIFEEMRENLRQKNKALFMLDNNILALAINGYTHSEIMESLNISLRSLCRRIDIAPRCKRLPLCHLIDDNVKKIGLPLGKEAEFWILKFSFGSQMFWPRIPLEIHKPFIQILAEQQKKEAYKLEYKEYAKMPIKRLDGRTLISLLNYNGKERRKSEETLHLTTVEFMNRRYRLDGKGTRSFSVRSSSPVQPTRSFIRKINLKDGEGISWDVDCIACEIEKTLGIKLKVILPRLCKVLSAKDPLDPEDLRVIKAFGFIVEAQGRADFELLEKVLKLVEQFCQDKKTLTEEKRAEYLEKINTLMISVTKSSSPVDYFFGGNWKERKDITNEGQARVKAREFKQQFAETKGLERAKIIIFPESKWVKVVAEELVGTNILVGVQSLFFGDPANSDDFTPEALQAKIDAAVEMGALYANIGHSMHRKLYINRQHREKGEPEEKGLTDEQANKIMQAILKDNRLIPWYTIEICMPRKEMFQEEIDIETERQVNAGINIGLAGITKEQLATFPITPEPSSKISTKTGIGVVEEGIKVTEEDTALARLVNEALEVQYGAVEVNVGYGASVGPTNAQSIFSNKIIRNALIGGKSLEAQDFVATVINAMKGKSASSSPVDSGEKKQVTTDDRERLISQLIDSLWRALAEKDKERCQKLADILKSEYDFEMVSLKASNEMPPGYDMALYLEDLVKAFCVEGKWLNILNGLYSSHKAFYSLATDAFYTLGENMYQHAPDSRGFILWRVIKDKKKGSGIEIIALDAGKGIRNIARATKEGVPLDNAVRYDLGLYYLTRDIDEVVITSLGKQWIKGQKKFILIDSPKGTKVIARKWLEAKIISSSSPVKKNNHLPKASRIEKERLCGGGVGEAPACLFAEEYFRRAVSKGWIVVERLPLKQVRLAKTNQKLRPVDKKGLEVATKLVGQFNTSLVLCGYVRDMDGSIKDITGMILDRYSGSETMLLRYFEGDVQPLIERIRQIEKIRTTKHSSSPVSCQNNSWNFSSDLFNLFIYYLTLEKNVTSLEIINDLQGKRILELGCGEKPQLVEELKAMGIEILGVDAAIKEDLKKPYLKKGLITQMPFFSDAYFDLVISMAIFNSERFDLLFQRDAVDFQNRWGFYNAVVKELARILRPDGEAWIAKGISDNYNLEILNAFRTHGLELTHWFLGGYIFHKPGRYAETEAFYERKIIEKSKSGSWR